MAATKPDFTGWATVYNQKCTDGRTIRHGAFDDMDGERVPLVWQHQHDDPENILGYAILHADKNGRGMTCDGYFNDGKKATQTKLCMQHGDVDSLSIYANQLTENSKKEVYHGTIKEVSVVMFGANSRARVDYTSLHHADMSIEEMYSDAIIYNGVHFAHGDEEEDLTEEESCDQCAIDFGEDKLEHADETLNNDYGIKNAQDLIDVYSKLPEQEMSAVNQFLAYLGAKEEVPEEVIKKVSSIIESKDERSKVALLTMLSIAAEG